MEKRCITPEDIGVKFPNTLPTSIISHAVRCSGARTAIYVSGQVSTDENGNIVAPGNLELQIHQVFRNLEKVLRSAGATLKDIISLNAYMTDIGQVGVFRTLRTQYLDKNNPPVITTVGVTGLAGPGLVFELAAVAEVAFQDSHEESDATRSEHRPDALAGGKSTESETLLGVLRTLRDLERSENPAVRSGCRVAAQHVWQVAFELGLPVEGK